MKLPFRRCRSRPTVKTPDDGMTLTEHLAELRTRIIRCVLAVALGVILIMAFYDQVLDFLLGPYDDLCRASRPDFCGSRVDGGVQLYILGPLEGFTTRLRISHATAASSSPCPVILWQIWRFIVPALHAKEKRTRSRSSSARSCCSSSAGSSPT